MRNGFIMAGYIDDVVDEDLPTTCNGGISDDMDIPLLDTESIDEPFRKKMCPYQIGTNSFEDENNTKEAKIKIILATSLCFIFMITEFLGGYFAGSLAIMTDAAHLMSDCVSFIIGLVAISIANKPPDYRMSFGYKRMEVLGAIVSILAIWLLTALLFYFAIERIITNSFNIDANTMMAVAGIGIIINIIMAFILHGSFNFSSSHQHCHSHSTTFHNHKNNNNNNNNNHHDDIIYDIPTMVTTTGAQNHNLEIGNFNNNNIHEIRPRQGSITNRDNKQQCDLITRNNDELNTILHHNNDISHDVPFTDILSTTTSNHHHQQQHNHQHQHQQKNNDNINLRAALIHVFGDFIQSVGVFLAAIVIKFNPNAKIADPICTLIFSVIVILTTIKIIKESIMIILDAVPNSISIINLLNDLLSISGVKSIHDLKVWSQTSNHNLVMAHITIEEFADSTFILKNATFLVRTKYNIKQSTFQIERIHSHDN